MSGSTHPLCQVNVKFFHLPAPIANELGWMMLFVGNAVALLIQSCHAVTFCFKLRQFVSGLERHPLLNLIWKTNKHLHCFLCSLQQHY